MVNAQFSKHVASLETREGCPITPGASFTKQFFLVPLAASNRDRRGRRAWFKFNLSYKSRISRYSVHRHCIGRRLERRRCQFGIVHFNRWRQMPIGRHGYCDLILDSCQSQLRHFGRWIGDWCSIQTNASGSRYVFPLAVENFIFQITIIRNSQALLNVNASMQWRKWNRSNVIVTKIRIMLTTMTTLYSKTLLVSVWTNQNKVAMNIGQHIQEARRLRREKKARKIWMFRSDDWVDVKWKSVPPFAIFSNGKTWTFNKKIEKRQRGRTLSTRSDFKIKKKET